LRHTQGVLGNRIRPVFASRRSAKSGAAMLRKFERSLRETLESFPQKSNAYLSTICSMKASILVVACSSE